MNAEPPAVALDPDASPLAAARALAPTVRAHADQAEREGRTPAALAEALAEAGLFRVLLPRDYGGLELDLPDALRVFEEVSRADGSAGWCLMIGAGSNAFSAWLEHEAAREMFASDPKVVSGGMFGPTGRAEPVDGGYRVTGRWAFGSGIHNTAWMLGNCRVHRDGAPAVKPNGAPETVMVFFPTASCKVIDHWDVSGLRGTGSHDFAVEDLFVPASRSLRLFEDPPRHPSPLYRLPFQALLWLWMAPVPLGIARAALDDVVELAAKTQKGAGQGPFADRPYAQVRFAEAEGILRSARALLYEVADEAWAAAVAGEEFGPERVATVGVMARHAAVSAARAVDIAHELGGTTSIRAEHSLQRRWRDVHVATQHVAFGPGVFEFAGKTLLGAARPAATA